MRIYPVIMCGGAGTRLWPASRPSRPKQFLPLVGDRSLFQQTVTRVAPLATNGGQLVIVAGQAHEAALQAQLAEIGQEAVLILEPEARDSGPAMAAAAAWIADHDPEGVAAVVASDHHIPDDAAFRASVVEAAKAAHAQPRIVTLGVQPTEPSSAYGYIHPEGAGLGPVAAFVEKPDVETARRYMTKGYLWNSGNFIVAARTLLAELAAHAPEMGAAAAEAVRQATAGPVVRLGPAFADAPKKSIDYAVMEKTACASVLPVDFAWSDLGAWDSVAATGSAQQALVVAQDATGCLVRAPQDKAVGLLGVSGLAVIVEDDAVLVCALDRAQDVKKVVEALKAASPGHLDFPEAAGADLGKAAAAYADWLRASALPFWATLGVDADGGFVEQVDPDGRAAPAPARGRVNPRQIWSFARAGSHGWAGPWKRLCLQALERFIALYQRPDGLFRTLTTDDQALIYDQAFILLAAAELARQGIEPDRMRALATHVRQGIEARAHPAGGWREDGDNPFQANAHMHLLEAALGWEEAGDASWAAIADAIVDLALARFIDADGVLAEFYDENWTALPGPVEPGHLFEWSWLLARYAARRSRSDAQEASQRLYRAGLNGVDPLRRVAVDHQHPGQPPAGRARLWPQTEWLKAALIHGDDTQAAAAFAALNRYLLTTGAWRDKMTVDGQFGDEPAPASTFYHLIAAYDQAVSSERAPGLG